MANTPFTIETQSLGRHTEHLQCATEAEAVALCRARWGADMQACIGKQWQRDPGEELVGAERPCVLCWVVPENHGQGLVFGPAGWAPDAALWGQ